MKSILAFLVALTTGGSVWAQQAVVVATTAPEDMALIREAGEKKLKWALRLALERKSAEDVAEVYGL